MAHPDRSGDFSKTQKLKDMYLFEIPTYHSTYKGREIARFRNGYYVCGILKADTLRGIKKLISKTQQHGKHI